VRTLVEARHRLRYGGQPCRIKGVVGLWSLWGVLTINCYIVVPMLRFCCGTIPLLYIAPPCLCEAKAVSARGAINASSLVLLRSQAPPYLHEAKVKQTHGLAKQSLQKKQERFFQDLRQEDLEKESPVAYPLASLRFALTAIGSIAERKKVAQFATQYAEAESLKRDVRVALCFQGTTLRLQDAAPCIQNTTLNEQDAAFCSQGTTGKREGFAEERGGLRTFPKDLCDVVHRSRFIVAQTIEPLIGGWRF